MAKPMTLLPHSSYDTPGLVPLINDLFGGQRMQLSSELIYIIS